MYRAWRPAELLGWSVHLGQVSSESGSYVVMFIRPSMCATTANVELAHESSALEVGRFVATVSHKPTILIESSQETPGFHGNGGRLATAHRNPLVVPGGWDEVAGGGCARRNTHTHTHTHTHTAYDERGRAAEDRHGLYAAEIRMLEMIRGRGVRDHDMIGYSFACGRNCRVGTNTIQEVPGQRDQHGGHGADLQLVRAPSGHTLHALNAGAALCSYQQRMTS